MSLPVLIVGDVHGDLERLFKALKPYPAESWRTIFLGDLVDGGPFGVGALRYARDRPNSEVLLGNHEVMMLWTLRDRSRLSFWSGLGGELHDLRELGGDPDLQKWLRRRPVLLELEDGTLVQHSDNDLYARLLKVGAPDRVEAINDEAGRLLESGGESELWDILSPGKVFRENRGRLERWLATMEARRLVHGHKPHQSKTPDSYADGLAIDFDGGLSRYGKNRYKRLQPVEASVAPLDLDAPWSRS
ncbi:MAG: metallophosphoesterase [Candidatus Dormibacteraeota bacterium]|nr:metallophosphoesterase [Candidatus Dormibacteraeota bacterium]